MDGQDRATVKDPGGGGGQDALLAFYMLNSKMLSSGEAGNEVRGTGQRLGANHHA